MGKRGGGTQWCRGLGRLGAGPCRWVGPGAGPCGWRDRRVSSQVEGFPIRLHSEGQRHSIHRRGASLSRIEGAVSLETVRTAALGSHTSQGPRGPQVFISRPSGLARSSAMFTADSGIVGGNAAETPGCAFSCFLIHSDVFTF